MKKRNDSRFLLNAKKIKPKTQPNLRRLGQAPLEVMTAEASREDPNLDRPLMMGWWGATLVFFGMAVISVDERSALNWLMNALLPLAPVVEVAAPEQKPEKLNERQNLELSLLSDSLFLPGTLTLRPEAQETLQAMVRNVKKQISEKRVGSEVEVQGYTDESPVVRLKKWYPTNWELSAARAGVVLRFFEESGFSKKQLKLAGFGDSKPLSSDQAKNRRILIQVNY